MKWKIQILKREDEDDGGGDLSLLLCLFSILLLCP